MYVFGVPGHVLLVGKKDHPLSIRRNMRKPVVVIVVENLLLLAAVSLHAPNLHVPGALRVEINVLTIWRIFRTVVQSFRSCTSSFIASGDGNRVDIKVAVALTNECKSLSVWRPAMPIRRRVLRDSARLATGDRKNVYERIVR